MYYTNNVISSRQMPFGVINFLLINPRRMAKEHRAYSLIVLPRHFLDEGEVIRFAYNQNLPELL